MKFRDLMLGSDFMYKNKDKARKVQPASYCTEDNCAKFGLSLFNSVDQMGYVEHTHADEEVKVYNPKIGGYE